MESSPRIESIEQPAERKRELLIRIGPLHETPLEDQSWERTRTTLIAPALLVLYGLLMPIFLLNFYDIPARFHLGVYWTKSGHCKTAVRHFRLAAAAGFDDAVQELWKCFHKGKLSKPDLEEALREHQQASDEMKSEERERYRALENALDGDDQILTKFYSSYYQGELSSKELNRALEAYKSNSSEVDLGVVRMLQPIFAPLVGNASEQDLKKFLEVHRAKMRTRKRRG